MKIGKIAAGLLAAAPLLAGAQSSVTMFGVVGTGVEYVRNVGATIDPPRAVLPRFGTSCGHDTALCAKQGARLGYALYFDKETR